MEQIAVREAGHLHNMYYLSTQALSNCRDVIMTKKKKKEEAMTYANILLSMFSWGV